MDASSNAAAAARGTAPPPASSPPPLAIHSPQSPSSSMSSASTPSATPATPSSTSTCASSLALGSNYTIHLATHRAQGNRPEQQDETLILAPLDFSTAHPSLQPSIPSPLTLLAVMDGHGSDGGKVARAVRTNLAREAVAHFVAAFRHAPDAPHVAIQRVLEACYESLHSDLATDARVNAYLSGTTLVVAVVSPTHLYVANVGDSRAVVGIVNAEGKGVQVRNMTTDHTCANATELERVVKKGARVERSAVPVGGERSASSDSGPLRIFKGDNPYPGLVVTRAIGDTASTALGVLSTPEVTTVPLADLFSTSPSSIILLLASDGVWDGLPGPADAIQVVHKTILRARANGTKLGARVAEVAAKKVIKAALGGLEKLQIDDNVSVVCVIVTSGGGQVGEDVAGGTAAGAGADADADEVGDTAGKAAALTIS
ncbi:phosphatase 2C-like domain-containing protein [Catenaria anguillulae PL171]|uniref:Phosphatase 2C-like domain-containing protein n=1 Tax=Catenaria anguillulae PL171 TaxID=765915 RepID=A0A1Y2HS47_9FUNG|nr:phosphatase 2C-like domain-containing protein [Catenaria anguillulae PL171]